MERTTQHTVDQDYAAGLIISNLANVILDEIVLALAQNLGALASAVTFSFKLF